MARIVRRVAETEGPRLREVRLEALADAPAAFGSTYEAELDLTDDDWAERARLASLGDDRVTFLALEGDGVVGLVSAFDLGSREAVELVSMWTAPARRHGGLGRALVRAVLQWAVTTSATSVELWVTRGNEPATRLYRSVGFIETGEHQPLPSDPCKDEIRMRLLLA